jgi:hypothetical protein
MAEPKDAEQRSALAATKAERSRDKEEAMREYEAGKRAVLVNTARLRELRLAKEAADALAAQSQPPAKKKVAAKPPAEKPASLAVPTSKKKAPRAAKTAAKSNAPRAKSRSTADEAPSPDTDQ